MYGDRLGRKVVVAAPSRERAGLAVQVLLYQLSHKAGGDTNFEKSEWNYMDKEVRC